MVQRFRKGLRMSKILVIEDNRANQRLFEDMLSHAGHDIVVVEDALAGLELARSENFDLIIMDIQLPGMDGIEATRALRSDPTTQDIAILAISAHAMRGDEERILAAGCDAYLSKPVRYRQLLDKTTELLDK